MEVMQTMKYIYIDALAFRLIFEMFMDYILLWATAEIARIRTSRLRLLLGGIVGAAYSAWIFFSKNELIAGYQYVVQSPVKIAFSLIMLAIAFCPISWRKFLNATAILYLIAFMSGGAAIATVYFTRGNWIVVDIVAIGTILIVAELGWGIIQKRIWKDLFHVPIEIRFEDRCLAVEALVDTGNRLRDPLTGTPVVILESSAMKQVIPDDLKDITELLDAGDFTGLSERLRNSSWSSKFRIIPYASIGKERGLLIGFRPTTMRIWEDGKPVDVENVIVGLHNRQLCPEGSYKALLHPDVFQLALSRS
jgi:stage II sporulation protein GA (sporulation sigma-E factor processing peptidase)